MTNYDVGYIMKKKLPHRVTKGGLQMFRNLNAELARKDIKTKDLAKIIGVADKTASNKLKGETEFTLSEIKKIAALFPDVSVEYLFATESA